MWEKEWYPLPVKFHILRKQKSIEMARMVFMTTLSVKNCISSRTHHCTKALSISQSNTKRSPMNENIQQWVVQTSYFCFGLFGIFSKYRSQRGESLYLSMNPWMKLFWNYAIGSGLCILFSVSVSCIKSDQNSCHTSSCNYLGFSVR